MILGRVVDVHANPDDLRTGKILKCWSHNGWNCLIRSPLSSLKYSFFSPIQIICKFSEWSNCFMILSCIEYLISWYESLNNKYICSFYYIDAYLIIFLYLFGYVSVFCGLMTVQKVESKLRVFSFEIQFGSQVWGSLKYLCFVHSGFSYSCLTPLSAGYKISEEFKHCKSPREDVHFNYSILDAVDFKT